MQDTFSNMSTPKLAFFLLIFKLYTPKFKYPGLDRDDSHNFEIHHTLLIKVQETAWEAFLFS